MLHLVLTKHQYRTSTTETNFEVLQDVANDPEVKRLCEQFRATGDLDFKLQLPVLLTSKDMFTIDMDGKSHKDGNKEDLDIELIRSKVPHSACFISPSGTGIKIVIRVSREPKPGERAAITFYLRQQIADITGLKLDGGRSDIAFLSDYPLHVSDGVFEIPDEFPRKKARTDAKMWVARTIDAECCETSDDLQRLADTLNFYPNESDYKDWLAVVIAALVRYGDEAIPLLEAKWESEIPYPVIQQWAIDNECNAEILDYLWATRIKKDDRKDRGDMYQREVITGSTGAGKTQKVIEEITSRYEESEDAHTSYGIYVVSSVVQALDFSERLRQNGVTFEVLVSKPKYKELDPDTRRKVSVTSGNMAAVKIVQLASLKTGTHYRYIFKDHRRLDHLYIDELVFQDFVRPSLLKSSVSRSTTGISVDGDLEAYYDKAYSVDDREYAMELMLRDEKTHFVSSLLFQPADMTVLSTEELTVHCLEELGYQKTVLRKTETKELKEKCTLHVAVMDDCILEFVQSKHFGLLKKEHGFTLFANNCEFADENLVSSKGKEILGKNLVVIRNLPPHSVESLEEQYISCFKDTTVDPVALFYKDQLMQAAGRSIGFRGGNEVWVIVHTTVWTRIKNLDYIYAIKNWDLELSPEFKDELQQIRMNKRNDSNELKKQKAIRQQKEKESRIKTHLINTGDPNDKITAKMLKDKFGSGFKLTDVEKVHGVEQQRTNSERYIEGFRIAA